MSTEGKIAVVTGGASGIGEATARRMAAAGYTVVIGDINAERGEAVATSIGEARGRARFLQLDLSDAEAVDAFAEQVLREHGTADALVNSGGLLQNAVTIADMDIAEFDRIWQVNVRGSLLASRAFGRSMAAAGRGSIITLCSLTSLRASPQPAYGMGKAALMMMTEIMAAELGPHGVRVNAVAPGYTMTPAMRQRIDRGERDPAGVIAKSAIRRFVEPDEVADAILFLCSEAASAITGATLPIDCGWLAYSAYDAYAAKPRPRSA